MPSPNPASRFLASLYTSWEDEVRPADSRFVHAAHGELAFGFRSGASRTDAAARSCGRGDCWRGDGDGVNGCRRGASDWKLVLPLVVVLIMGPWG